MPDDPNVPYEMISVIKKIVDDNTGAIFKDLVLNSPSYTCMNVTLFICSTLSNLHFKSLMSIHAYNLVHSFYFYFYFLFFYFSFRDNAHVCKEHHLLLRTYERTDSWRKYMLIMCDSSLLRNGPYRFSMSAFSFL